VNAAALTRLIQSGIKLRAFPIETIDAAFKAANEFYAEQSAKNALFKKGYDSMVAFRKENYTWWQVGEYSYDSYMLRTIRG
jgi:TRAP-type mannitol/chloroaromatic compound transport system substrate-binding protein